jgi:hypothetical protein
MAPQHQADRVVADGVDPSLTAALREVGQLLAVPGLEGGKRKRLLQRQAELGDLRDERALRARRRLSARR